eukprot:6455658-Ditylum_brightwellii.AAC.1
MHIARSDALCIRVQNIEKELGLGSIGCSISERILVISEIVYTRIRTLEKKVYDTSQQDFEINCTNKPNKPPTDRLGNLEKAMGTNPTSPVIFQRIQGLETYIDKTKSRIDNIDECVYGNISTGKAEEPLQERLGSIEKELDMESRDESIKARVKKLASSLSQRVTNLERQIYKQFHRNKGKGSLSDRME